MEWRCVFFSLRATFLPTHSLLTSLAMRVSTVIGGAYALLLRHFTPLNVLSAVLSLPLLILLSLYIQASLSPLHKLPGPQRLNVLIGDYPHILTQPTGSVWKKWRAAYGPTHRFSQGIFAAPDIVTSDLTAIAHLQRNPDLFIRPTLQMRMLGRLAGDGLLMVNNHTHRRQRRIVNPAFSPAAIREVVPAMYTKANELCERLASVIDEDVAYDASPTPAKTEDVVAGARKLDMGRYLTEMAFDVIGLAALDVNFNCERVVYR